eukprot:5735819-Pleurochrysis_carterae.AAC.4
MSFRKAMLARDRVCRDSCRATLRRVNSIPSASGSGNLPGNFLRRIRSCLNLYPAATPAASIARKKKRFVHRLPGK